MITAMQAGVSNISVCQTGGQCATLYITVSVPTTQTSTTTPAATATTTTTTQSAYVFPRYLGYGDKGDDVLKLQQFLAKQGLLSATPNGHFGLATKEAVKKFQKAHSIKQTGNVGTSTKEELDKDIKPETTTKDQQISQIQQMIQQLQSQLSTLH